MTPGINNLFPTPVLFGNIDNIDSCHSVLNEILTNDELYNSISISDGEKLFEVDNTILNEFKENVVVPKINQYLTETIGKDLDSFNGYKLKGWMSKLSKDKIRYIPRHNHKGSFVSMVFYILSESDNLGGEIVLQDPRPNANRGYTDEFSNWFKDVRHNPKTGDFLIFPSFLYHYVDLYSSDNRIAIAIDLYLYKHD
jgi:hypothetical protein